MKRFKLFLCGLGFLISLAKPASAAPDEYPLALQDYQAGQYDKAIQECQSAVQMNPNYWQAFQVLGYCYYEQKNNLQALQAIDESLRLHPDNAALRQFEQQLRAVTSNAPPSDSSAPAAAPTLSAPATTIAQAPGDWNRNLPRPGKLVLEVGDSDWIGSLQDLENLYNTTLNNGNLPLGFKISLGGAYALTPNLLVGVRAQYVTKETEQITIDYINYGFSEVETFTERALGGALALEGVFPLNDGVNVMGSLEGGYYTFVGSNIVFTGTNSWTDNLAASNPGGMVCVGLELVMDAKKSWALDFGLDYQFLTFTPVNYTFIYDGQAQPPMVLKNQANANADLDFSGFGFFATLKYF